MPSTKEENKETHKKMSYLIFRRNITQNLQVVSVLPCCVFVLKCRQMHLNTFDHWPLSLFFLFLSLHLFFATKRRKLSWLAVEFASSLHSHWAIRLNSTRSAWRRLFCGCGNGLLGRKRCYLWPKPWRGTEFERKVSLAVVVCTSPGRHERILESNPEGQTCVHAKLWLVRLYWRRSLWIFWDGLEWIHGCASVPRHSLCTFTVAVEIH